MRWLALLGLLASSPAIAAASPEAMLCHRAIAAAEAESRVPARLLEAIANVESGRPDADGQINPWPWTINALGEGHFYATKAKAISAVIGLRSRGVQSIDVGCMQVNLLHHPRAFSDLAQAFDPHENARYAGLFLNDLYAQTGAWPLAAAAYHSWTPALAKPYQRRVMAQWQRPTAGGGRHFEAFSVSGSAYRSFQPAASKFSAFASVR